MSNLQEIKTNYLCQCTVSITDEILPKQINETKENFNNVLNIHEIDEDDDCENDIVHSNNLNDNEDDNETIKDKEKNTLDDEYAYTNESFYSDESCSESEETASQYLVSGSCSLYIDDNKCEEDGKLENLNGKQEEEIDYNEETEGSISVERSERIRQSSEQNLEFVRRTRRKNMSFTDDEVRKIERENELLLRKIMAQHKPRDKVLRKGALPKMSSSAINRKRLQKKIEGDNMMLLRRIQQAKPCVISKSTTPGYRMTFI
ncbi:PREDICTED: cilia- and flagella-associated protein 97-like [Polistes canadensis]|uniref:cilia- and flagella-associated protein 97-like n=1 Tax=Polistes canadensis TaxID=91411 RepID=UPI000718B782|nr:PREDICTED: cilia- and flagella-associated protein 97-like [Polistes canadensis]